MLTALSLLLAVAAPAHAQDGVDASGILPPPVRDGDPLDPPGLWIPDPRRPGEIAVSGLFSYADDLAVSYRALPDGTLDRQELLGELGGLNLGFEVGLHERASLALALPTWFTSTGAGGRQGPALGDLRLSALVNLSLPGGRLPLAVSLVPYLGLPTGSPSRYLGDGAVTGGALLAAGLGEGRWQLHANAGLGVRPELTSAEYMGTPDALGGLALSFAPLQSLALHLEGLASTDLLGGAARGTSGSRASRARCSGEAGHARSTAGSEDETVGCAEISSMMSQADTPTQLGLSGSGSLGERSSWTAGLTLGTSAGVGAPAWSAQVGVATTLGGGREDQAGSTEKSKKDDECKSMEGDVEFTFLPFIHRASPPFLTGCTKKEWSRSLSFEVRFLDSYDLTGTQCRENPWSAWDTSPQGDVNKLMGIDLGRGNDPHDTSIRLGWRWDLTTQRMELRPYAYYELNGEQVEHDLDPVLVSVPLKQWVQVNMQIHFGTSSYITITAGGVKRKIPIDEVKKKKKTTIMKTAYFGGDCPAPKVMHIEVRNIDISP